MKKTKTKKKEDKNENNEEEERVKLKRKKKRRVALMHQVLKIRQFSRLQKRSSRKRGLMQRWLKGLMILRRYQLKLRTTSVKKRKYFKSKQS